MRYTITEFDIFNAITCVGQDNKFLWDSETSDDLEVETRMECEEKILKKIKKYLKKEHNLIGLDITDDDILYVWDDYYFDLCKLIDNSN